jgi:predicted Zn-dependent protease
LQSRVLDCDGSGIFEDRRKPKVVLDCGGKRSATPLLPRNPTRLPILHLPRASKSRPQFHGLEKVAAPGIHYTVQNLGHPEKFHIIAATGWLELGDWKEAGVELDQLPQELNKHPDVLQVRWAICSEAKDWDGAVAAAQSFSEAMPDDSFGYVHQAFALHELKRTQEAWDMLHAVADKFSKEYLVFYNLACYACQLGQRDEAIKMVTRAITLGGKKKVREMALHDRDLESLRDDIKEIG